MNCMNCGTPLREGDKFCLSCGSPVHEMPTQPQPGPLLGPAPTGPPVAPTGSPVLFVAVVFSIIGAIMLLVGDFGGWYNRGYYIEETVWIDAWSIAGLLIIPMALLLFFVTFASLQAYRSPLPVAHKMALWGLIAGLVVFIVTLVGGLILIVATWENTSNWLDVGFYGGLFGGLISFIVLAYERRRMGQALGPMVPLAPRPYGPPPPGSQPPPRPQPPAQRWCKNCGAPMQPGTKFCMVCGAPQ